MSPVSTYGDDFDYGIPMHIILSMAAGAVDQVTGRSMQYSKVAARKANGVGAGRTSHGAFSTSGLLRRIADTWEPADPSGFC